MAELAEQVRAPVSRETRAVRGTPARRLTCGGGGAIGECASGGDCGGGELGRVLGGAQRVQGMMQMKRALGSDPSPGSSGALDAMLNSGPRVQAQLRLRDALNPRPTAETRPAAQRAAAPGVVQRVIYDSMDGLLAAVLGGEDQVPDMDDFDPALQTLFTEAEDQLPNVDVEAVDNLDRLARIGRHPDADEDDNPPYQMLYRPGANDPEFLVASMLHELLHASTDAYYDKEIEGTNTTWWNLHLPEGLDQDNAGDEVNAQQAVLEDNLDDAERAVRADDTLGDAMRDHVLERIQYAQAGPRVHYDTVLADILAYMQLNGVNAGPTFSLIRRMVLESTDRRTVGPWWGIKRARRVERNASWYEFWKW